MKASINNATLALVMMNEHSQCVYMNTAAENLIGFPLNEVKGKCLYDFIYSTQPNGSPDPFDESPITQAFSENQQTHGEGVVVHKDGSLYPITYTATPLREDPSLIGTIVEIQAPSQRKPSEQLLKAASFAQQSSRLEQQKTAPILEKMTDAFIAVDEEWRITYQNRIAEQITQKSRAEIIGNIIWEEWSVVVGTQIEEQFRQAMSEQVPVHFEYYYADPPDYEIWLEIRAYPSREGLGIFYRDISDRKRSEIVLRESQAQLQRQLAEIEAIYQSAPIGLSVLDRELRFVRINERLAQINGLSVEDHIGRTVQEVLPSLETLAEEVLRPIIKTGEPRLDVEIRGETPSQPGVERIWLEHFLPLKDEKGRVIGISAVCEDITERQRIQEALQESGEHFRTDRKSVV